MQSQLLTTVAAVVDGWECLSLGVGGWGWFGLGCWVVESRHEYDVWLFEVDVGVGVELWRRLWCLLCFTVGRVLCAG